MRPEFDSFDPIPEENLLLPYFASVHELQLEDFR